MGKVQSNILFQKSVGNESRILDTPAYTLHHVRMEIVQGYGFMKDSANESRAVKIC